PARRHAQQAGHRRDHARRQHRPAGNLKVRVLSLNVGTPRVVHQAEREVTTGIFKTPVARPVMLRRLNLDGDRQADLTVHGGATKAVYAYPSAHYDFWRGELPGVELPWGMF